MADSSAHRYNHVLKVIDEHLIPDSVAKAQRGEVFTPPELVQEILFGLRKDKLLEGHSVIWGINSEGNFCSDDESNRIGGLDTIEIWQNPRLTWLDPANGIGNFPLIAFYKLDFELAKLKDFKDKEYRQKYIIEKMLFMVEIDKGNCATSKAIFQKICPSAKINLCCADSLSLSDEDLVKHFGTSKFDIIMGNPPFNPGILWEKFIRKYTPRMQEYMLFIVPSTFTSNKTGSKVLDYLKDNGLQLVKYLTDESFKGAINLDTLYFVLKKSYAGKININLKLKIERNQSIVNLTSTLDKTIFEKIREYEEKLVLFRGSNKTLSYTDPKETENIKFKKSASHHKKMISRLGGGEVSHYFLNTANDEGVNNSKVKLLMPRGTGSYNSKNNLKNLNKDMVYSMCESENLFLSDSIMFIPVESGENCSKLQSYMMRSKLVRFIFLKMNHLAELTKTIVNSIPKVPNLIMDSDEKIFKEIGLSAAEINHINSLLIVVNKTRKVKKDKESKSCLDTQEMNPRTRRCVNKCVLPSVRDPASFKCKAPKKETKKTKKPAKKEGGTRTFFAKTRKRRRT